MSVSNPFPHVAIRASAGSGKTYKLTNRYIGLLIAGESPARILATTFTRKAAGEIAGRVLTRLSEAVLDDTARRRLGEALELPSLSYEQVNDALLRMTQSLHRVGISTIDSFFVGVAKAFSLELGFPPQWEIVEPSVASKLRARAVETVLRGDASRVVALIRLLSKGELERSVAAQVRETVDALYSVYLDAPASAWDTIHPAAELDREWLDESIERLSQAAGNATTMRAAIDTTILQAKRVQWRELLEVGPANKLLRGATTFNRKAIPDEVQDALLPLVEHAKAVLTRRLVERTTSARALLEEFDKELSVIKRLRNGLRFDDVTRALAEAALLDQLDDVFFRLDGRIHHLLLDEFQDTSLSQWRVLRPLADEVSAHATPDRSMFLVGDVKQAIYGWRGGVADILDSLSVSLPGLTWLPLDKSYRSSQVIIDTVNYVFGSMDTNGALAKHKPAAAKWKESFRRHATTRTELTGYARVVVASEASRVAVLRDAAREVAKVAAEAPHAKIGVLTRTNDAVGRMIFELKRRKLRASEEGGNPLTDSPAVTLVLSLLRLADHPGDSVSRYHVQHSPLGAAFSLNSDEVRAPDVARRVREELLRDGYGACVLRWAESLAPVCDARETRRLTQLVRLAHRHDAHPTLRAIDFVAFVEQEKVEDPTSAPVRVMTIHQAKGLEFDMVVLVDLDRILLKNKPAVLVDAPSPTSPPTRVVRYPNTTERLAAGGLDGMAEAWRQGAMRENLSLLYVALTRAVHELLVVVQPREPRASVPLSFEGILTDALARGKPCNAGTTIYAQGDEIWSRSLQGEPATTSSPAAPAALVRLRPRRERRRRNLPRTSPSALEGGELVRVADMLRLDTTALRRGSILHALFEQIEWLEAGVPGDASLLRVARRAGASEGQATQLIREFRGMLESDVVRGVLLRASYDAPGVEQVQVHRELSFALRDGGKILTGAVDRLVIRRDGLGIKGVEVLDYKTDHVEAETLADKIEHYRPQLQAYRKAAAHLFHVELEKVTARLVFVCAGRVEEIR